MNNSTQDRNRQPKGRPTGGQFAEQTRSASGLVLSTGDHEEELPEVMVDITWQVWNDRDHAVDVGSDSFDLAPFIAETPPDRRITEFGDPGEPGVLDYWVTQAQQRGLIGSHDGPFDARSSDLEDLVQRQELEDLPTRSEPRIIPGVPLAEPLTVAEVLAEANEEGVVTATVSADLHDLLAARSGEQDGEHDLLASKVSPLPPSGSSYTVRGTDEEGRILLDFTTDVRSAAQDYQG